MPKILFYVALVFIIVGCNQTKTPKFSPKNKLVQNGISIPIVNFNELEPLLNIDNDTTYVINFWATWCKPCIKELPYFEELNRNFKSEKLKVILVSLDFAGKTEKTLMPYVIKNDIKSQVIHLDDTNNSVWIPKVNENWEGSIPATLIYNSKQRKFYEQSFDYQGLEKVVAEILNF